MPEIFTATGDSVCCLQRIGKKPLPYFHIFLLPTFLQTAKSETLKTLFTTGLVQDALLWNRFFSANFRLTSERPLALFFDTKNTFRLCLKLLRQQATVSVVCNGLATSLLPHFHIFLLPTFLQTAKSETLKTPLTTVLANALVAKSNAMVAKSTVVATECNKVFGFSLKNVYYFIK